MTAAVERTEKFQYQLNPLSGADIWLIAPVDERGRQKCADLHLSFEEAEAAIETLRSAIESGYEQ